jgi:hypothetical protein
MVEDACDLSGSTRKQTHDPSLNNVHNFAQFCLYSKKNPEAYAYLELHVVLTDFGKFLNGIFGTQLCTSPLEDSKTHMSMVKGQQWTVDGGRHHLSTRGDFITCVGEQTSQNMQTYHFMLVECVYAQVQQHLHIHTHIHIDICLHQPCGDNLRRRSVPTFYWQQACALRRSSASWRKVPGHQQHAYIQ